MDKAGWQLVFHKEYGVVCVEELWWLEAKG